MASREDLIKSCMSWQSQLSEHDLQSHGLTTLTEEALEKLSVQELVLRSRMLKEIMDSRKPSNTITVKPKFKKALDNLDIGSLLHKHEKKEDNGKEL